MKTLKCNLCEVTAEGETFEQWMNALMPHYMEAHADVMMSKANLTDEEKKTEMNTWVAENKARFESVN